MRRATLSLDSDLAPDADLLVRAAHGAVWLADLPLADRLAEAAIRAGAGPEPNFVRAHALSWLGRGEEAEAVLAEIGTGQLTDGDRARFAFLRASNMLWALGDPARAKELIDEASRTTPPQARTLHRRLPHGVLVCDGPAGRGGAGIEKPCAGRPARSSAPRSPGRSPQIAADAGRTTEAVAVADAGYAVATRSLDAPHMRFNIADAQVSALLLAGRVADALEVAERMRRQAADLPGAAQLLGAAVAGRAALGAGHLHTACSLLRTGSRRVVRLAMPSAGGTAISVPRATALAMRGSTDEAAAALAALDERATPFPAAGLRAEPGPGVGGRGPGRRQ